MTDHHHTHDNEHKHGHSEELSFEKKLETLFTHWIDHNNSHMENFLSWAKKAKQASLAGVAQNLEEAGMISREITKKIEDALTELKDRD
jgi:hypothetical protein